MTTVNVEEVVFANMICSTTAPPKRGCVLSVRLEIGVDRTVTASWYDIWAAAIALRQMCVVQRRSGAVVDVGMFVLLIFSLAIAFVRLFRAVSSGSGLTTRRVFFVDRKRVVGVSERYFVLLI